ncbi:MAG: class I SAM-dependent methyltransferase [Flavipsychrobacter sp.]
MDATFWDTRYSKEVYAYGEEPNKYLAAQLNNLKPEKILFPADGEGRNSVYAAKLGWDSYAFDQSSEGKRKAELLATKNKVKIHYQIAQMPSVEYQENEFDAIALIFAHFGGNEKLAYLKQLSSYLKKGGIMIFEAYSKNHMHFQSINSKAGGPSDIKMLYSIEELENVFNDYEIITLKEEEVEIHEGPFHGGMSSVIRFVGTKK